MQYSTVQCSTVQYSRCSRVGEVQYSTVQYSTVGAIESVKYTAVQWKKKHFKLWVKNIAVHLVNTVQ